MIKYLLEDWTAVDRRTVKHPTQALLDEAQVMEAIDAAHKNDQKIRIHIIGPCVLDWTNDKTPENTG